MKLIKVAVPPTVSPILKTHVAPAIAVGTSRTMSMICELAGITTVVAFAEEAPLSSVSPVENVCAITTCPVFFTFCSYSSARSII